MQLIGTIAVANLVVELAVEDSLERVKVGTTVHADSDVEMACVCARRIGGWRCYLTKDASADLHWHLDHALHDFGYEPARELVYEHQVGT